ncbi:MAG TPA: DUF3800 domain-containing protein [bacterium]|nr:DUF3800 domain-containing protein [bacterium]HQI47438.1 DUF3800 domain-containing protein [bacterium]HQJ64671.1 DUF3800 domain-containing protein [bacterium]
MPMDGNNLYIFIDEGGNLDFSNTGTAYFTLTALSRIRPFSTNLPLLNLKYDLWEEGIDFEYFHATTDSQRTRDRVFEILATQLQEFNIDSIIVDKRKTNPSLREHHLFYQKVFQILLNYIFHRYRGRFSRIFILTDEIPVNKKKSEVQKAIKTFIASYAGKVKGFYTIQHYSSKSDLNLQIVDYFNWAIFRKWERKDERSYRLIRGAVASEFDVFASGKTLYY